MRELNAHKKNLSEFTSKRFEVMRLTMHVAWKDHTVQRTMVLVRINFLEKDFLKIDVKTLSGEYDESMMLLTVTVSPFLRKTFEVDLGYILSILCEKYQSLNPGTMATYYDETSDDEVRCPKDWLKIVRLSHKDITLHGIVFDVKEFVVEIPLNAYS